MNFFNEEVSARMKALGQHFGYPECCIQAFLEKPGIHPEFEKIRTEVAGHWGFIPCLAHAEMISRKEIALKDLISNRICWYPFPIDYSQMGDEVPKDLTKPV